MSSWMHAISPTNCFSCSTADCKKPDFRLEVEMDAQFDDLLCKRYPTIFRDRHESMQGTTMCWGFACGSGWFPADRRALRGNPASCQATQVQPVIAVR